MIKIQDETNRKIRSEKIDCKVSNRIARRDGLEISQFNEPSLVRSRCALNRRFSPTRFFLSGPGFAGTERKDEARARTNEWREFNDPNIISRGTSRNEETPWAVKLISFGKSRGLRELAIAAASSSELGSNFQSAKFASCRGEDACCLESPAV